MRRRPVVPILMLIIAVILPLPVRAQQKPVAPGLSPARAYVATSLPRHGGVKPPLRHAALKDGATTPGTSPAKPPTQEQVSNMVRDGFGDESGAKLIEQPGIDFAPAEDFLQTLKAAGASEAFLKALRAAVAPGLSPAPADVAASLPRHGGVKPPLRHAPLKGGSTTAGPPASAKKPLNQVQVFALLAGQVPSHRVTMLVEERGIDFEPNDDYLQEVRLAGGEDELISALKSAKVTKPVTVDPAAQARQAEARQHVAHGAESFRAKRYADAESEFRAAVRLDPQNAELHDDLGVALGNEGDWKGEIAEYREALHMNPNDDMAHNNLGATLGSKGDWDGAVAEYRDALRLNPSNDLAHVGLAVALGEKGEGNGEITEYREALRLNPNNDVAHYNLGVALGARGDGDGEIMEYREALRLNPNHVQAHCNLGSALGHKGDWDGAIAEFREALRSDPNLADAHYNLGCALEEKGDRQGALEEFRAAYMLDPKDVTYKQNYERLLRQVNQ